MLHMYKILALNNGKEKRKKEKDVKEINYDCCLFSSLCTDVPSSLRKKSGGGVCTQATYLAEFVYFLKVLYEYFNRSSPR